MDKLSLIKVEFAKYSLLPRPSIADHRNMLLNPVFPSSSRALREQLVTLADALAPAPGYNATLLDAVRILRTETVLNDVPVLYKPGAVFVLQGSKTGMLENELYLYDEEHYLAVALPVPFRMQSEASPARPLLAIYVEFDMQTAADIVMQIERHAQLPSHRPRGLVSSKTGPDVQSLLLRLLTALGKPAEAAVLGSALLRELHYRVLIGPQGGALVAALQQKGVAGRVVRSLSWLRENYSTKIALADLAKASGMSVSSYHIHFREVTGSSPIQYLKAMRLHEARLMIAGQHRTIADVAAQVGYASTAQFSRDFKRHFGRTASEEVKWVRRHLGEEMR
ncbi:AraC family transcriptional regulator [Erwinia sp. 9145]|uniref:AraC family transcriptional regulator n=1 Tax=Erwinia sp. 9145 TaxID=1500895 RepID=UPI0018CD5A0C|nr:AraC family transcriptional regulator [Erwinia sp. 9145]